MKFLLQKDWNKNVTSFFFGASGTLLRQGRSWGWRGMAWVRLWGRTLQ